MNVITPHIWYEKEARAAAELYASVIPESRVTGVSTIDDTPSGTVEMVSLQLGGQPFEFLAAGPFAAPNPSISFLVACSSPAEVDAIWPTLAEGGSALMELGSWPFSERYGWTEDRYGVSWQVMAMPGGVVHQRVTPTLMFVGDVCGRCEEAVGYYTSIFEGSTVGEMLRYSENETPEAPDTIKHVEFSLTGRGFAAMDSAHEHNFAFNEAISLMVKCDSQEEIDRYWDSLTAVPESEQCGWLKDRYGVSWQIVPTRLDEMMAQGTDEQRARVTEAFLAMKKFDLAQLEAAYRG